MLERLKEREQAINRYLNGALGFYSNDTLCQQVPEIRPLLTYLFEAGRFVEPASSEPTKITGHVGGPLYPKLYKDLEPPLLVSPIDDSDTDCGTEWVRLLKSGHQVQYVPAAHLVTLRMDFDETPFVLGISLLHEVAHAYRAYQESRAAQVDMTTSELEIEEERLIYLFEGRTMAALNPSAYEQAMSAALVYIANRANPVRWQREPTLVPFPEQHHYLDQILGPIDDQGRRNARHFSFAILAHCAYAARCAIGVSAQRNLQHKILRVLLKKD